MAEVKKKLAIIDGKSVFYRGYYAMPNLSTKDGTPTGGVYGFTAMALELIKRLKPDYVAVAWDKPKTNIRKRLEIYPQYKAGRKPAPPDFYAQIPILQDVLKAFNWPLYELDDYEADDIMCAMAKKADKKGFETMLITSDLDILQCISPTTHVYVLKKGLTNIDLFHQEAFRERYGIEPEQFLDLKSLKGDSSDNIPGVPGIGEKTAMELLKTYKSLDNVYDNLVLIKESVRKKLEAGKESAYLSKKVCTLFDDAPIPLDLEHMDVTKLDVHKLAELLRELEFKSLLRQLPEMFQVAEAIGVNEPHTDVKLEIPKLEIIESDKALSAIKQSDNPAVIMSRAAGKHGKQPEILIISPEPSKVFAIKLSKVGTSALAKVMPKKVIGYDTKATLKVFLELGLDLPEVDHDILISAYLINSLLRQQSLTDLAYSELGYEGSTLDELTNYELIERSPELSGVIRAIAKKQAKELGEMPKVKSLNEKVEMPVQPVIADMEHEGIQLNAKYLNKFADELADQISDYEQQIYGFADMQFNIASPSQLAEVLFDKLGLPTEFVKKNKTGYSTAANELDKLRDIHPIINLITQFREVTKLKNTYVDTLPTMVDENSRVHTTFNLTVAPTGRLSSVDPNLQNIPVRTPLGKKIRTAFEAKKGSLLVSADYSQFELRIAAALSGDKGMVDAFNRDADIHIETAALIYGIKPEEVTKEQRYSAKAVNFGIMYGQGPHGLSQGTGMPYAESKQFIAKYFEIRPKLKEYIDKLRKQAEDDGYVETVLGRRRPTPDVKSSNFVVREGAYRQAVNMPIQGTAADLTKLAMIEVDKKLGDGCKILLQIHDSLLIECSEAKAKEVGGILKDVMENIYPELGIKLKVDVTTGKNWGEL